VASVNDEFRLHDLSVAEWAAKFEEWAGNEVRGDLDASVGSKKRRTPSMLKASEVATAETARSGSLMVAIELTYRYFLNLAFNPGMRCDCTDNWSTS
jgi:hypothetical protein